MDLLDRINALTDDQLRMVAERDDASGVLAAYRLAELRGLPCPDREAAILGDGYVIVAQNGTVQKVPVDSIEKIIREEGGEYCVYSHDGTRTFGCYPTMGEAEDRLRQIHVFRSTMREGSFVSWNSSGGTARGQIEHVMREGVLGVPGSDFSINATEDDPAVLIRIWREGAEGWAATETLVGHKMSTLTAISPLSKAATKRENDEDFPAEAFAYVPDPDKPSTWKLRLWETLADRETRAQVGRAVAAMGPRGFRGNRVQIPSEDLAAVRERIAAAWRRVWAGENDEELPDALKAGDVPTKRENGMDFPAEAFAYVPEPLEPSTWRLRVWESPEMMESREQIGIASRQLGTTIRIPAAEVPVAQEGIRDALERLREREEAAEDVSLTKESYKPPQGVQDAAARALEWIAEGHAGSGFTDVGRARAAQLARGEAVSADTIRRMASYLARHDGDSSAEGFNAGEDGFPSPGRVAWDAWGGDPAVAWTRSIVDRLDSADKSRGAFLRKEAYKRFTLGPLYVPDFMDAHGEWTDSTELQQAVWEWVKGGDRTIYLQHDRDVRAGEWVEVMTMPQPWTVNMLNGNGEAIGEITYPAGTVFLGVIWDEGPWEQILRGELRGYSIGGFSDRVLADLPEEAARDGIELAQPEGDEPSLAKSIADAVAEAMRQSQPVVNVVMPEAAKAKVRRIERDEHGNIARIIEEDE
jgi:hypothetical protein